MTNSRPTNVVLVDDDRNFLDLIAVLLGRVCPDIALEPVTDAESGLELVGRGSVDAVVTDYRMPGTDGLAFLRKLRERDPEIPVLFFTGLGSEDVASEAIAAGVTDYLRKATDEKSVLMLGSRIRTLVDAARAERTSREADERVREAYERITAGVLSLGSDWEIEYANGSAADIFGFDAEVAVGESVWTLVPGLDGEGRAVLEAGEERSFVCRYRDRWLDVTVYPGEDGVSLFVEDETDYRETRAALEATAEDLERSEEEFRVLRGQVDRPVPAFR